jgi:hypothetical protein
MNFLIHDRLLAFLAGVLVISTVAVWKTGTSHYNTIILHLEFWCLFFSLIWLLYFIFIFIFPCIFFFNLNPRFQHVFLEKSWLAKSSARKVDMLYNFEKLCLQWQGFFTISVNLYRGFRSVIKLRWYQKFSARSSLVDFSRVIAR